MLLEWVIDQIGEPREAMQTIYNAVMMYNQFLREQEKKMKQMSQQTQVQPQPAVQQQAANPGLSSEDEKLIKLIKALKDAGVIWRDGLY